MIDFLTQKFEQFGRKKWLIYTILLLAGVGISIQNILLGANIFWEGYYTHYNNYVIFKSSFIHLLNNTNLYGYYKFEHGDFYKYSPTFALLMAPFYYLPDAIGLSLWNVLNMVVFYYAITVLKINGTSSKSIFILLFVIMELVLAAQNTQSNGLLAAFNLLAFAAYEKGNSNRAAFFIVLGSFIKIYSVMACLLLLLYPKKIKAMLALVFWFIFFLALPLLVINLPELVGQYKNWWLLLQIDHNKSIGMSMFSYVHLFSSLKWVQTLTLLAGMILLLLPLLQTSRFNDPAFRLNYLCLLLLGMVLLNHKAESPTYIIAVTGVATWMVNAKATIVKNILCWGTFFFTSVWFTDIVPSHIRKNSFDPLLVKPFFPVIIFFVIAMGLLLNDTKKFPKHTTTLP